MKKIDQDSIKDSTVIPGLGMIVCQAEKAIESPIKLPDGSDLKTGFSMLVVRYVSNDCKIVKIDDIVILAPLPKKFGQFEIVNDKYIMVKEDEVGVILRRKKEDSNCYHNPNKTV